MYLKLLIFIALSGCALWQPEKVKTADWLCHRDVFAERVLQEQHEPVWLSVSPVDIWKKEWLDEQIRLIYSQ